MTQSPLLYFDNGTTSWPKSPAVSNRLAHYYDNPIGSYGRSTAPSTLEAMVRIEWLRDQLAQRLGGVNPEQIVLNSGATESINTILNSLQLEGRTLWISPLEHNAVMRPLHRLKAKMGFNLRIMPAYGDGRIDVERLRQEARPSTSLAIVNAESNVNGVIQPLTDIASIIGEDLGIPLLLDTAQYLGYSDIPQSVLFDYIVFSGHKGLLGPTGVGGFFIKNPKSIEPLIVGGNGIHSENYIDTPLEMPERFSAGTPNMLGLDALVEAVKNPVSWGTLPQDWEEILFAPLEKNPEVRLLRAQKLEYQGPLFSLYHVQKRADEIANALRHQYNILVRDGLHCAPLAHQTLGTLERGGTVRISLSPYHTRKDLQLLAQALEDVLR